MEPNVDVNKEMLSAYFIGMKSVLFNSPKSEVEDVEFDDFKKQQNSSECSSEYDEEEHKCDSPSSEATLAEERIIVLERTLSQTNSRLQKRDSYLQDSIVESAKLFSQLKEEVFEQKDINKQLLLHISMIERENDRLLDELAGLKGSRRLLPTTAISCQTDLPETLDTGSVAEILKDTIAIATSDHSDSESCIADSLPSTAPQDLKHTLEAPLAQTLDFDQHHFLYVSTTAFLVSLAIICYFARMNNFFWAILIVLLTRKVLF